MISKDNMTDRFLDLCKKSTQKIMMLFDTVDTESLIKIHNMNSDFNKIKQIDSFAYKKAQTILSNEIYELYVNSPKVNTLKDIFINALNKDNDFRKNIYESISAENRLDKKERNSKNDMGIPKKYEPRLEEIVSNLKKRYSVSISREEAIKLLKAELGVEFSQNMQDVSKPVKKTRIFEQTAEEMKFYMEKKYNVSISRKEALGVLKTEFGEILKEFVQSERNYRSNHRREHLTEKLKDQKNNFIKSNYMEAKNHNKKVGFDLTM